VRKLIGIENKAVVVERAKREGSSYHKVKVRQLLEAKIHRLGELFCIPFMNCSRFLCNL